MGQWRRWRTALHDRLTDRARSASSADGHPRRHSDLSYRAGWRASTKGREQARAADFETTTGSCASRHDGLPGLSFTLVHLIDIEHEPLWIVGDDDVSLRRVDLHEGASEDNVGEVVGGCCKVEGVSW